MGSECRAGEPGGPWNGKFMIVEESLHEHIQVSLSDDGSRAFAIKDELIEDTPISETSLVQLLEDKGIIFGVKDDLVRLLLAEASPNVPILVAEGIAPTSGKDGWLECHIDLSKKEVMEEKGGKVDLHNLNRIHNVRKGERIATVHPPQEGVPGMSVKGLPIAAISGKRARVFKGSYVTSDPSDLETLTAAEDGNLVIKPDGTIEVQPVITIRGDIDFSTGDIDFIGSMIVTGDMKSDFTIKVQKNLEIRGDVGDATIIAGGNVVLKKGFLGRGKGSITAGGNVSVHHVLNQTITSDRKITIEREAVCAKLNAGDAICSSRAKIVGCVLRAGNTVEVFNLGNGDDTQATVYAGHRAELIEKHLAVEKELEQLNKQSTDIRDYVYKLIRSQLDAPLTDEQSQLLAKLKRIQVDLPSSIGELQKKKIALETAIRDCAGARVIVRGTVFMNVLIDVNGVKKLMHSALREVMFTEKNGKLEEQPAPSE